MITKHNIYTFPIVMKEIQQSFYFLNRYCTAQRPRAYGHYHQELDEKLKHYRTFRVLGNNLQPRF
jgi:hypothetical protein